MKKKIRLRRQKKIFRLLLRLIAQNSDLIIFLINLVCFSSAILLAVAHHWGVESVLEKTIRNRYYLYGYASIIFIKFISFYIFKVFHGLWRYVTINDLVRIFFANLFASIVFLLCVIFKANYISLFPVGIVISDFLFCLLFTAGIRALVRVLRELLLKRKNINHKEKNDIISSLIVGEIKWADNLIHSMNIESKRRIAGILSNEKVFGKLLREVPIYHKTSRIGELAKLLSIDEILLLPPYNTPRGLSDIMLKLEHSKVNCNLRMIPTYSSIAEGDIDISMIKNVEIEDLLERSKIEFNDIHIIEFIKDKNVLITGAGGSIGSELVRQVIKYAPGKVIMVDNSEYNLYKIDMEISKLYKNKIKHQATLADVSNKEDLSKIFTSNKIDIVFHAAAVKHVPILEDNMQFALKTNLVGTANVANLSEEYNVKKMVLVSTDKAVNPTSAMGSTKRLAERVVIERSYKGTDFVIVRFGNVLGLSGSVIPLFKEQISNGGPVTVTSKNMTRFFMLIPEAVNLILQASTIGKNGNIMVLEMDEPVKIYDLARKLIELSGLRPDIDIKIEITGLRPGEKEYEEILTEKEKVNSTVFDKIYSSKFVMHGTNRIDLNIVQQLIRNQDKQEVTKFLRDNIPEAMF